MPIKLQPITESEYPAWFERSVADYAKDKIQAKQWGEEGAIERARKDTERFLQEGISTPNHSINHIVDINSDEKVGSLWWCKTERFGRKIAYIFDVYIEEQHRRKGYATSTLKHLEWVAIQENMDACSLHVFAFNKGAHKLYEKLGYEPTSITMTRELADITDTTHKIQ